MNKEKKMTICGVELSASEARLVLLEGKKDDFILIDAKPRKIKLNDETDQKEVKAFRDSIFTFLKENEVSIIAIKKRGKKGAFSGGSVGFKLEGIIQLYEECPVILVPPQTISATMKRYKNTIPKEIMKYQHIAFETAFTKLS